MPVYKFRKVIKDVADPKSMKVFCTICNEKFVPEAGGDPICPDCFKDDHQPNLSKSFNPTVR